MAVFTEGPSICRLTKPRRVTLERACGRPNPEAAVARLKPCFKKHSQVGDFPWKNLPFAQRTKSKRRKTAGAEKGPAIASVVTKLLQQIGGRRFAAWFFMAEQSASGPSQGGFEDHQAGAWNTKRRHCPV